MAFYRSPPTCSTRHRFARLAGVDPTDVFIATWLRQATEAENIRVNRRWCATCWMRCRPAGSVHHVALVTGLKHYLGPFEAYGKGALPPTPFREEQARLEIENFYYAQEDEVFAAAKRDGFSWSVHRPHTIIGYARRQRDEHGHDARRLRDDLPGDRPAVSFPGSAVQWNSLTDMTDAGLLARHLQWAVHAPEAARNQAFNVVNGDVFRWKWMWARLADWFGLKPAPYPRRRMPLEHQLAGRRARSGPRLHASYGLVRPDLAGSPRPGTRMPISAVRSRWSPI